MPGWGSGRRPALEAHRAEPPQPCLWLATNGVRPSSYWQLTGKTQHHSGLHLGPPVQRQPGQGTDRGEKWEGLGDAQFLPSQCLPGAHLELTSDTQTTTCMPPAPPACLVPTCLGTSWGYHVSDHLSSILLSELKLDLSGGPAEFKHFPNFDFPWGGIQLPIRRSSKTDHSSGHGPNQAPVEPGPWGPGKALGSGLP